MTGYSKEIARDARFPQVPGSSEKSGSFFVSFSRPGKSLKSA